MVNFFGSDRIDDVIMTLKSKFKTIFEFSIFKLCHMPNLKSIGVKMPELRRGGTMTVRGMKRPRPERVKLFVVQQFSYEEIMRVRSMNSSKLKVLLLKQLNKQ